MTLSFVCVLIASLLPIVWAGYAKLTGGHRLKHNRAPREFLEKIEGKSKRAKWAHDNSWEAFAPFAAAVIIAHYLEVDQNMIDKSAIVFIMARVLYGVFYIFDKPTMRSGVWFIGFFSVLNLYYQAWV